MTATKMSLASHAGLLTRRTLTPLLALIHRSAWKGYSPKFVCRILHIHSPKTPETPDNFGPAPIGHHYMLWCCIKFRLCPVKYVNCLPRGPTPPTPPSAAAALSPPPLAPASLTIRH